MNALFESPWFRHPRVWLLIGAIGWLISIVLAISVYTPPTVIPDSTDLNKTVQAGTPLNFSVPVVRYLDRRCSVDTQRFISGPTYGARKLGDTAHISAETLRRRESLSPGVLSLTVYMPTDTVAGPTTLTTENRYRCLWSPLSWFWPIDDSWEVHYNVVAARQGVVIVNPPE